MKVAECTTLVVVTQADIVERGEHRDAVGLRPCLIVLSEQKWKLFVLGFIKQLLT